MRLKESAFAALLLAGAVAPAAAQPCPALRVRNTDGNYIIPGSLGDIPFAPGLALDAYVQRAAGPRASVVVVHGGGWSAGSRVAHIGQLLETVTRAGYHWFSVDYRLGGLARYEDSLADLRAALAFIRCRGVEMGIDPDRLILLGEDSGAHLAALAAAERPAGVIGAVLVGGFYDVRPIPAATGTPLLVVHGGDDRDAPVEHARTFCAAAARCRFLEVPGASHRSENWWPSQWSYKREIAEWLATLAPVPSPAHVPKWGAVRKDVVFDAARRLTLDAFTPRSPRPVPAVIIAHGGGWEAGDKVTYVTPLFEPLARAGLAWFSIDYRLTPDVEHQDQIDDVRRAIRFVRDQHRRFNVDPARIVLVGESASGQIVAHIAAEDPSLAGVISFYGVYDFPAMVTDASPRSLLVRLFRRNALDDESREILKRYSPLYTARREMPPMLLINGTGERLWGQAQAFARRLAEIGARHELIALDAAPHGLENWEGRPEWTGYKDRMIQWIERVTGTGRTTRPSTPDRRQMRAPRERR